MTTPISYDQLVTTLANLAQIPATDANFLAEMTDVVNYAEQRIYRDLDFLSTRVTQSVAMTPNSRTQVLPGGFPFVVVEQLNAVVGGIISPMTRQSRPYMDLLYNTDTATSSSDYPVDYCLSTDVVAIVGPPPGSAWTLQGVGTYRPPSLSLTNETTWLSTNLPDLLVTACMIRVSGYMKNYSATSDDPQQALSWQNQYDVELKGASVEEARRKAQSASWSDQLPIPQSTPPRS